MHPLHLCIGGAFAAATLVLASAGTAQAHVTLEGAQAFAGASYKAVLRVPHGCEGKPTNVVRVRLPEGFIAAKPQPKAGWELTTVKGKFSKTYDYHGTPVSEGVTEVVWSGGNLPDEWYDEFVVRGQLTDFAVGSTVYFPVIQECPDGATERWIEIPAEGKKADDYEMPAPGVRIIAKPAS